MDTIKKCELMQTAIEKILSFRGIPDEQYRYKANKLLASVMQKIKEDAHGRETEEAVGRESTAEKVAEEG